MSTAPSAGRIVMIMTLGLWAGCASAPKHWDEAVAAGDENSIPGVGMLRTETVPERRDFHPSTGAAMTNTASPRVVFEPAS